MITRSPHTLQPDANFGRILAAYGGVFVAGSLAWGVALDGFRPDRYDRDEKHLARVKLDALDPVTVADELRRHGAGASTFSDWWMYKLEAFDATPYNMAIMHEKGVLTSLNSDIPWLQASLLYEMQKPVKYGGVPRQEAMKMVTLNNAKQLRIDHIVGSLEVGKNGDIVLLDGDRCFYADEDAIAPLWKGKRFSSDACVSGWVMRNRQNAVIRDVFADPRISAPLSVVIFASRHSMR